jgi:hypothetical protein
MPKTDPWHSAIPTEPSVYHDNTDCVEGENIRPKDRRYGTDDRPRCRHCTYLESQDR